LLISGKQ